MFLENSISKYAYIYMAQPLLECCPSFCLMLMGIDNKFKAESVLNPLTAVSAYLRKAEGPSQNNS